MNRPFKRLWSAIERLPDLAAVPDEWRSLLGSEYELAGRFLLPTQRIARSGKCTVPGRNCVHEFRPWKGEYLSVCPDGCDTVTLPRDEVVIHRLDEAALGREIAEAMGLEALPAEAVPEFPNVLRIGEYVLAGHRFPVCLVFTGEPDQLRCDVDGLAARAEPFVLLAPTRSAVTHACADLFKRAKSSFLPLNELLGQGDDGRLALLDGHTADNVLADFRAIHVSQPAAVQAEPGGGAAEVNGKAAPQATPETDPALIYQAEAATCYNIPPSVLCKAAKKKPGEPGYLWSGRGSKEGQKKERVWFRKEDLQKIARSREALGRAKTPSKKTALKPVAQVALRVSGKKSLEENQKAFLANFGEKDTESED